ncbi:hypothetical protein BV25DRAFT_1833181 [Artomyces pyxidatus]|uniref:Uncharacterized protein n=1 Tax=Artomyces pyxidatus TaxID=48021 RepID=A0ACB8SGT7_9AGAM|nr:hypothetical protein BV25DRAFT_1833181 [Artomyces pyxidatus]
MWTRARFDLACSSNVGWPPAAYAPDRTYNDVLILLLRFFQPVLLINGCPANQCQCRAVQGAVPLYLLA